MTEFVKSAFSFLSGAGSDRPEQNLVGKTIEIPQMSLKIKRLLAQGGYAVVYEAQSSSLNKPVAIKRLLSHDRETSLSIMNEIDVLKNLNKHVNIVEYIIAATIPHSKNKSIGTEFLIVTEFCKNGQISSFLPPAHSMLPLSAGAILQIFYQTCSAVQHMHGLKPPIVHRDLKIENLLISEKFTIKLCDFGSATCETYEPNESWTVNQRGLLQEKLEKMTTPMYRPPEMIDLFLNFPINTAVDIWALGCILYYLTCTFHPFEDSSKLAILNANYRLPELSSDHSIFTNLICQLLLLDPRQRPKIGMILNELMAFGSARLVSLSGSIPLQEELDKFNRLSSERSAETIGNIHTESPRQTTSNVSTPKRNTAPNLQRTPSNNTNDSASMFDNFKTGAGNWIRNASSKVAEAMQQVPGMQQQSPTNSSGVDLNYITSRIAVMSYPNEAASMMHGPRNSMLEVQALLDTQHSGHYSVFNVSQFPYQTSQAWFGGRFLHKAFASHTSPSLVSLLELCISACLWLKQHPSNVCIIHCIDGKASSAMLVASILCFCCVFTNPMHALQLFTSRRCNPRLNASQRRYLGYIVQIVSSPPVLPHNKVLCLIGLKMSPFPLDGLQVGGDVIICISHARSSYSGKGKVPSVKICQLQFHTGFVKQSQSVLEFSKVDLDHLDPTGGTQGSASRYSNQFMVSLDLMCSPNERPRSGNSLVYPWETNLIYCDPICCFGDETEMQEIISDFNSVPASPAPHCRKVSEVDSEILDGDPIPTAPEDSPAKRKFSNTRESTFEETTQPTAPSNFADFESDDVADLLGLHRKSKHSTSEEPKEDDSKGSAADWYSQFQFHDQSTSSQYCQQQNDPILDDDFLIFRPEPSSTHSNPFFNVNVEDIPHSQPEPDPNLFDLGQSQAPPKKTDPFADLGGLFDSIPKAKPQEKPSKQAPQNPFQQQSKTSDYVPPQSQHRPSAQGQQQDTSRPRPKANNAGPSGARPYVGQDAFSDLLNGFGSKPGAEGRGQANKTIHDLQFERETRHLDAEAIRVRSWAKGKEKNLRALLCTLELILWEGVRYTPVSISELQSPDQVKKAYRNAARAVHPDKWLDTQHQNIAKYVFMELNDAMIHFEKQGC
ncbi:hypothetical protein Ciccas_006414 [Cichlidogyrus casuarinus]|uniref:Cyclin-G-associated kinase n=1 Tax=Cichlidogyrus casuarinus TaxID=1844966 RepID=A0ABD2Q5V1_9PLAT